MQKEYAPYNAKIENQMELSSLYVIFVSFFVALLSSLLDSPSWISVFLIAINSVWLFYFAAGAFIIPFFKNNSVKKKILQMKKLSKKSSTFDPMSH